ncbi:BREX-1 system adenine-specific DNA-methyltransferase PglX [Pseudoclavibacter soli]|uniref:BREX-1 system adenine-specific DNA-methyltransferase PglX n=1 Tax=Pseudoclavibacter soli TaxID=452623 RepID=UPI00040B21FE|nr:BREX-1 system adenine-specific DNA-methyltransferase PglX [Pseudoclavibacter soli]
MEPAPLKSFATWARTELITQVSARIAAVLAPASPERTENPRAIRALETDIATAGGDAKGKDAVADKVAYTWFNRIIALRFMDANGYTNAGVVSPPADQIVGQPEVLADAKRGTFDPDVVNPKIAKDVTGLLDGTRSSTDPQGEAYTLLLAEYSRYWNKSMPFMFKREGDYTELLIPSNLLADESILARAVTTMTSAVCEDVEVIGWLYQFYISDRKDEVFAGFKKNKKAGAAEIPAATQLFTPHWIVRYLVENSVGRLWMLNHPESRLVDRMDYYIAPADEETDFLKLAGPEELTVIDPACGSGHMLTYAFDLLYAIYEEEGYSPSEIPTLILTHNLHGTEIDHRAGALAAFALTMKARARQRSFFTRSSNELEQNKPSICVIEPIVFRSDELDFLIPAGRDREVEAKFWNQFEHADTFGSLIRPDAAQTAQLAEHLKALNDVDDLLRSDTVARAMRVIHQAQLLARQYAVAVANPPYMGSKQMNSLLSQFMKDEYSETKQDLYGAFVMRGIGLADRRGLLAIVIGDTWMSIKSFEALRTRLLDCHSFDSFLHMRDVSNHPDIFGANAAFVLSMASGRQRRAPFIRLTPLGQESKEQDLRAALVTRTPDDGFHLASSVDFEAIPGSPIVYWLSEKLRAAFSTGKPLSEVATLRQGLATADNNRFLRQWWEVSRDRSAFGCTSRKEAKASGARWFPYNKGGEFRKWYGNHEHVVNWENDGAEIVAFKPRSVIRNPGTYFSPSVSWSDISSGEAAFRRYPSGFIYANTGHSGFGEEELLDRLALLLNSTYAIQALRVLAPTMHFDIGYVGLVPVAPGVRDFPEERLADLMRTAGADWDSSETSWGFERSPLVEIAARH